MPVDSVFTVFQKGKSGFDIKMAAKAHADVQYWANRVQQSQQLALQTKEALSLLEHHQPDPEEEKHPLLLPLATTSNSHQHDKEQNDIAREKVELMLAEVRAIACELNAGLSTYGQLMLKDLEEIIQENMEHRSYTYIYKLARERMQEAIDVLINIKWGRTLQRLHARRTDVLMEAITDEKDMTTGSLGNVYYWTRSTYVDEPWQLKSVAMENVALSQNTDYAFMSLVQLHSVMADSEVLLRNCRVMSQVTAATEQRSLSAQQRSAHLQETLCTIVTDKWTRWQGSVRRVRLPKPKLSNGLPNVAGLNEVSHVLFAIEQCVSDNQAMSMLPFYCSQQTLQLLSVHHDALTLSPLLCLWAKQLLVRWKANKSLVRLNLHRGITHSKL